MFDLSKVSQAVITLSFVARLCIGVVSDCACIRDVVLSAVDGNFVLPGRCVLIEWSCKKLFAGVSGGTYRYMSHLSALDSKRPVVPATALSTIPGWT